MTTMIDLNKFKISGWIDCFNLSGYNVVQSHSLAFLYAIADGIRDLSDFYPNADGVLYRAYTQYGNWNCYQLQGIRPDPEIVTSTALKVWKLITHENVEFTPEEVKLLKDLGIDWLLARLKPKTL